MIRLQALNLTTVNQLNTFVENAYTQAPSGSDINLVAYWRTGGNFDYKQGKNQFTDVEGVGIFETDAIENILFGMWHAWTSNSFSFTMSTTEYYPTNSTTMTGVKWPNMDVDDLYDSYSVALGWLIGKRSGQFLLKEKLDNGSFTDVLVNFKKVSYISVYYGLDEEITTTIKINYIESDAYEGDTKKTISGKYFWD